VLSSRLLLLPPPHTIFFHLYFIARMNIASVPPTAFLHPPNSFTQDPLSRGFSATALDLPVPLCLATQSFPFRFFRSVIHRTYPLCQPSRSLSHSMYRSMFHLYVTFVLLFFLLVPTRHTTSPFGRPRLPYRLILVPSANGKLQSSLDFDLRQAAGDRRLALPNPTSARPIQRPSFPGDCGAPCFYYLCVTRLFYSFFHYSN